ncbi:MAG: peptidase M20 [candidate division Zixibacteria bacterium RBG-1]|nr:MAG: peptidase M20 [candidate division Zixibacteria bacterium RBG-1]
MSIKWFLTFLIGLSLINLTWGGEKSVTEVDFKQMTKEATAILSNLIKINTVNPPGNELEVIKYVANILDQEKIHYEILESAPGRGNLIARLKGNGSKPPLMLMAHVDVVGVEKDKWKTDPFGGEIKDGYLYGRGAIDDKGMGVAELVVLLQLKRGNVPLARDVILLLEADEEAGGKFGIEWLVENHLDKIKAEFVLNEGGRIITEPNNSKNVEFIGVQNTEKVPYNVRLVASGTSGHASVPLKDNCIFALSKALEKLSNWQPPVKLNPTTKVFFKGLAKNEKFPKSFFLSNIETPIIGKFCADRVANSDPILNSTMRSSISPTLLEGGIRSNVIPSQAEVNLNVRLLPEENIKDFVQQLQEVIGDDPRVKIEYDTSPHPHTPASPTDNELFRAMEKVGKKLSPEAVTVPLMSTGATDASHLRAKGIPAYGILPFPLDDNDLGRMHGHDERLHLDDLEYGIRYLYEVVSLVAKGN